MYLTGKSFCTNRCLQSNTKIYEAQGKTTFENEYMKVPTKS